MKQETQNIGTCYEIMHGERKIAEINTRGEVDYF